MTTDRNDDNILNQAWVAATDAMDDATAHTTEAIGGVLENATETIRQQTTQLADKTVEKTTENMSRQEVIDERVEKNQPNVAVSYAAITASVGADKHFSDEQKASIEARIKEVTLAQEKDIAPDNMQVARIERQHVQNQNLNKDLEMTA